MTPKQKEQYFKKQQEALARINKIEPMIEVVNTTSEQVIIDRDNVMLDAIFDYITAKTWNSWRSIKLRTRWRWHIWWNANWKNIKRFYKFTLRRN